MKILLSATFVLATALGPVHSIRFVFTSWNLDVEHESTDVER